MDARCRRKLFAAPLATTKANHAGQTHDSVRRDRRAGRGREPGRRPELADPAGDHGRSVRPRRRHRRVGTHRRPPARRDAGPAGGHRKRRRRRRHGGLGARGQGGARRLSVRARQPGRRHQPDALQEPALQSHHRSGAGRADRRSADGAGRAQGPAGRRPQGVHRLRQEEPGRDAVRLGRRRLHRPCRLRAAQRQDGGQHRAHSLPRRRSGDAGSDRRPHRLFLHAERRPSCRRSRATW